MEDYSVKLREKQDKTGDSSSTRTMIRSDGST